MEPTPGLEPGTARLQVECATNCATPATCRDDGTSGPRLRRDRPTAAMLLGATLWTVVRISPRDHDGPVGRLAALTWTFTVWSNRRRRSSPAATFHSDRPARSCR